MINIIPQTEVRLLKTPLEKDSEHTLSWTNINNQTSYFYSRTFRSYTDFTYVKEFNNAVTVPSPYDEICSCNYLMYKNNGFTNKWFYAFITKMEYVNENMTRIYFEIDSLQTWYFNIEYHKTFVEREHVNNDTVGLHTIPEMLETGDYIDQSITIEEVHDFNLYESNSAPLVVCSVTQTGIQAIDEGVGRTYNGIYSGLINVTFPNASSAEIFMLYLDSKFSDTPVVSVFMAPYELANPDLTDWDTYTDAQHPEFTFRYKAVPESDDSSWLKNAYLKKTNYLDSNYVPRNKKLLCYPYKYFIVDNNVGVCNDYKYEYFSDSDCRFQIDGALSVGCSIKLTPIHYMNTNKNYLYSIDAPKLPTCSWVNDAYTNYLTANAVNIGVNYVGGAIDTLVNAGMGNYAGAVNGVMKEFSLVGQIYEHSKMPLVAHGGQNQGDICYSDKISYKVYKKSIKREFAEVIDSFFDKYGYKVNSLKVPNITGRRNWNYVKTVNCNFTGDLPQEDLQKIKNIFNNGITFWHNSDNFLNYSVKNDII